MNNEKRLQDSRRFWDSVASSFDDEPDHGLLDPVVLKTWTEFLKSCLPASRSSFLDLGCGTGSLSVLLAGLGHSVTGIDLSPAMISTARAKATSQGVKIAFHVMDAAFPRFPRGQFDVLLCRHLLWVLPEPEQVLQRWVEFLKPGGRLLLIEGHWETGAGLHADEIIAMLPPACSNFSVRNLSEESDFWGKEVTDGRYAIIADF